MDGRLFGYWVDLKMILRSVYSNKKSILSRKVFLKGHSTAKLILHIYLKERNVDENNYTGHLFQLFKKITQKMRLHITFPKQSIDNPAVVAERSKTAKIPNSSRNCLA